MSVNKLSISAIKKMPVVLGEVDVLKSILLPEQMLAKAWFLQCSVELIRI
jgi:hypothetical protein